MPRSEGSKNIKTLEFVTLYDKLSKKYGDPVEVLFKLANGRYKHDVRIRAANCLLPFRYSKRIPEQEAEGIQGELTLAWDSDNPDKIQAG